MTSRSELFEIERIVSEIADDGASAEQMGRLDSLLRDRPDLQEHYARVMALHVLLDFEFDLSMQQFQPVVARPERRSPRAANGSEHCAALSLRIGRDLAVPTQTSRTSRAMRHPVWAALASAAAVAAVFLGYGALRPQLPPSAIKRPSAMPTETTLSRLPVSKEPREARNSLVVRDAQSLRLISRLTKTPTITSLVLPRRSTDLATGITLCSGTAWMEKSPTERERGYVVALPPGYQMDVHVYTDAAFQNALSVVELDDDGRMTGGAISFSNLEKEDAKSTNRRLGSIGDYSEFNDRQAPKYYLLTGSHRTPQQKSDELWRLSDFEVQHDSSDIMVIGWEDSGYVENEIGFVPDRDFNDIRVMLRFSRPGAEPLRTPIVKYSPEIEQDLPLADDKVTGFPAEVKPGEVLVLLVSGSALLQNTVRVVDAESRRIIWQDDGRRARDGEPHDIDRGVYVVRNDSPAVRRYEIQAQLVQPSERGAPIRQDNPYKAMTDGDRGVIIGFEDSITVPVNVDWNDVRVYARWLSE